MTTKDAQKTAQPLSANGGSAAGLSGTLQFEQRKRDHIEQSLSIKNQALGLSGFESIQLVHEALPDLDFEDIKLETKLLGHTQATPLYINSMTAGHPGGASLNLALAEGCSSRGWALGVGSQRRELFDQAANAEWKELRAQFPKLFVFGNLGISQLIQTPIADVQRIVDGLQAQALAVHLNPLQECMQPEGTPHFRGGLKTIEKLVRELNIPILVKETGCGMSRATIQRLFDVGVHAVDVSGLGGTHWGRIEGARASSRSQQQLAAETFAGWGISTATSVQYAAELKTKSEVWASGGVRSGLDAAKLLALGATAVGYAQPALAPALAGVDALTRWMKQIEFELRVALFCTGAENVHQILGRLQ